MNIIIDDIKSHQKLSDDPPPLNVPPPPPPANIRHLSRLTFYGGVAVNRWEYSSMSA